MEPELDIQVTTSLPAVASERLGVPRDAAGVTLMHELSDESKARIHQTLLEALRAEIATRRDTLGFTPGEELNMGQSIGQGVGQSISI